MQKSIHYTQFDVSKILNREPEQRKFGSSPMNQYKFVPLLYSYTGDNNTSIIGDLLLEGCEMDSNGIIEPNDETNNYKKYSIQCIFNLKDTNHANFLYKITEIYRKCAEILFSLKETTYLKFLENFDPKAPEKSGFRSPIYSQQNKNIGKITKDSNPSMYFKLIKREYITSAGKNSEMTVFMDPNGNEIPWHLLTNVNLKFIPLIWIKGIYLLNIASIQMEIISAVVTSVISKNKSIMNFQKSTLESLKKSRPELVNLVSAQVSELSLERKESPKKKEEKDQDESKPWDSKVNIVPISNDPLKEFISTAPTRTPLIKKQEINK